MFFKRFKGFLGIINSANALAFKSFLLYLTNLWASVATKVKLSELNWKKTPLITGLKSSFPEANIVELIAFAKTILEILVLDGLSSVMVFGNWSPSVYAKAYFPWFELISMVLLSSTVKVSGCSGNVFNVSIRSFDGIATEPLLELSTSIDEIIVVSRSLEVIFNLEPSKSNKKWSKTGIVFEVFITPPRTWSFFKSVLLETMNFIGYK